jgi:Na+-driven multidrug efflux pump
MMRSIVPGYIILAISHNLAGALRGSGQTKVPMIIMIFSWCICRIAWITIMVKLFNDIQHVFMGWPITWVISTVLLVIYFKRSNWLKEEQT